jgi:ubiquinone/menaquinone biosynthesis C-methylase UbiE
MAWLRSPCRSVRDGPEALYGGASHVPEGGLEHCLFRTKWSTEVSLGAKSRKDPQERAPRNLGDVASEEARIRQTYLRRRLTDGRKYSPAAPVNIYFAHAAEHGLARLLGRHFDGRLESARILEVGCGNGLRLRNFLSLGARPENLTGVELVPEILENGRRLCPPGVTLISGSATALGFPDNSFDLVLQSMMLSSIVDPAVRTICAAEMVRMVKPGGLIVSYDFFVKDPNNRDTVRIGRRELRRLFGSHPVWLYKVLLVPPLARLVAPRSLVFAYILETLPFLRSHYFAAISKDEASLGQRG